jgi:hypothetical protein
VNAPNERKSEPFRGATVRYPFHSHEVRDVLASLAKRTGADPVAVNWFLGHSIDKLRYDKSPWDAPELYRLEYLKLARPSLNPISGVALKVEQELSAKFEQRLASLEQQMQDRLGMKAPS